MSYGSLVLILMSVLLSSVAQLVLKFGMSRPAISSAIASKDILQTVLACVTSSAVVGGLALYGIGAVVWLAVLAKVDVSVAYPFFSVGFVFTMLLAALFLGEHVTLLRAGGVLLIVAGCTLVAQSA